MTKKFTLKKLNKKQGWKITHFLHHRKEKSKHPSKRKSHLHKNDKKDIKKLETAEPKKLNLKEIILLIDAAYWGLNFGVVVFKDAILKSLFGGNL